MPHRLSGLLLNRVDLVPDGSNPDAHIVLFKSKGAKMARKTTKKTAARKPPVKKGGKPDSRSKAKQQGDEDDEDDEDDEPRVTKGRRAKASDDEDEDLEVEDDDEVEDDEEDEIEKSDDDEDEEDEDDEDGDDEEEDEEEAPRKKSSKKPTKKTSTNKTKKPAKKIAKADDDEDDDLDDEDESDELDELDEKVMKSLPASVRARIEKTHRIAKQAQEIAKAERDKRVSLEFVQKAKKEIPNLTGTNEEKGELLKALFSGEPLAKADAKAIYKLLKTGDSAIRNLMMAETGVSKRRTRDDDDESAQSELEEIRDEILKSKDGKSLTSQQAMAKACEQHPDLYKKYRMEKSRNRRSVADVD